jgi:hypothetical protein
MSKQTAVEWLEKCFASHWNYEEHAKWDGLIHQAKQMEKEQVQNAFNEGVDWHRDYFGKQKGMVKNLPDTYGGNHE